MKNKLKVVFLCMLYVIGYQPLSAGQIDGDFKGKSVIISRIINNLKDPRNGERISPVMVAFAPRAFSMENHHHPLIYDNFYCALVTSQYNATRINCLRTDPLSPHETVKAYLALLQPNSLHPCFTTTSARAIFTVTQTSITYDDDGPARIQVQIKDSNHELGETRPYVDITLELANSGLGQRFSVFGPTNSALNLTECP